MWILITVAYVRFPSGSYFKGIVKLSLKLNFVTAKGVVSGVLLLMWNAVEFYIIDSKQPEREDKLDSNSKDLVFSDTINQDQRSSPGKIKKNKELMEAESNPTIDSTNGKEKSASKLDSSLEAEAKKTSPFKNLKLNIPSPSKVQQMSPGQKSKKAEQEVKLDSTVAQNTGLQSFGTSTSKDIVLTDPISEEQPSSPGMININKELKEAESNPKIDSRNEKEKAAMKLDSSLDAEEKKTTPVKKLKLKLPRPSKMQQNSPGQSKNKKDLVLGDTVKEDNVEKNVGEKESKKTSTNEEKQESPGQSKKNKESEDVADVEEEKKKGENLESEVEKLAKDANPTGSMLIKDAKMKKKQESAPKKKAEQNKTENEKKEVAKAENSDDDFQVPKKEPKDKKGTGNVLKGRKKTIPARKMLLAQKLNEKNNKKKGILGITYINDEVLEELEEEYENSCIKPQREEVEVKKKTEIRKRKNEDQEGDEKKKKLKETKAKNDSNVKLRQERVESKTVGEKKKRVKEETTREGKSKKMKVKDVTEEQDVGEKKIENENDVGEEVFKTEGEEKKKKLKETKPKNDSNVKLSQESVESKTVGEKKKSGKEETTREGKSKKMIVKDVTEEQNVGEKKIVNENDVGEEVFKTPSESGLKKKIQFEVSEENSSVLAFVDQLEQQALSKSKENEEAEVMLSFGFSKMTAHDKDEEEKDDQINDVHISTLIEKSEFLKVDVPTDFEQRLQETEDLNKKESSAEAAILKINENEGRPKRKIVLSDILRSPYVERPVMMKAKITKFESDFSEFIFSASLNHNDIVFATESGEAATRDTFESLCPGVEVHLNVINAWSRVLNYQERFRNKDSPSRLFLSPMMLEPTLYAGKVKNETRLTHFESNMDSILKAEKLKSISGIDIVIIPMLCDEHYYVLCLNLKTKKVELIDNIKKAKKNYKMWPNKMV
ncbi:hypothetical protein SSX86_024748 [Deinandra increscens subsp. villosa]|uniref:Ubiquitin-like protease family profile domain-containing protein n=1 Tax=Deinandra increscens subsp. villosa TaxID=3103831 RepID=A0AAP0CB87_9ASTR